MFGIGLHDAAVTALLAAEQPRPTAQTSVIDAALVVSPGEPNCYGEATWSLVPLNANPSVEHKSMHWAKFPPATRHELLQITHTFINRSLLGSFLLARSGAWRTRMNAEVSTKSPWPGGISPAGYMPPTSQPWATATTSNTATSSLTWYANADPRGPPSCTGSPR
ncbi:hypothetical protein [Streptomyces griseorubiginosus]|uniref:hypothetical protein n=1 Tax=Streptomyces griseorubiginosus TaxID=67304 RepID=UPI002E81F9F1|nr:hypothetical protein [Streptomyces griseorubiginosus]WUB43985.1 hypothetical protein OHN19_11810 [Streptomyces griseorubiginosus]WUB52503.1 hypothetical protein OG942_11805 [Streptomyces griseorubiginosus]